MNPTFSIIIPVYNVDQFLTQCIESLLSQVNETELILVDDGSTDGSPALCDTFAAKHECISVYHIQNSGVSAARNLGIRHAKGKYVTFTDSDDFWIAGQFDALKNFITANPTVQAFMFDYKTFDQNTGKIIEMAQNVKVATDIAQDGKAIMQSQFSAHPHYGFSCWRFVIRHDFLIEQNLFFLENLYFEDVVWVSQLFFKAKSVMYYPHHVYMYRRNLKDQISGEKTSYKKIMDRIWISAFLFDAAKTELTDAQLRTLFVKRISELYFSSIVGFRRIGNKSEIEQILHAFKVNSQILEYPNSTQYKIIALLCKVIGFRATSALFYAMFKLKKRLK